MVQANTCSRRDEVEGVTGQSGTHHARGREAGGSDAVTTAIDWARPRCREMDSVDCYVIVEEF